MIGEIFFAKEVGARKKEGGSGESRGADIGAGRCGLGGVSGIRGCLAVEIRGCV